MSYGWAHKTRPEDTELGVVHRRKYLQTVPAPAPEGELGGRKVSGRGSPARVIRIVLSDTGDGDGADSTKRKDCAKSPEINRGTNSQSTRKIQRIYIEKLR